jgi:putative PIN family toxin of toxin-antitoxin system
MRSSQRTKPNVVLDASVVVSASLKQDLTPARALFLAFAYDAICVSTAIVDEIDEALARPRIAQRMVQEHRVRIRRVVFMDARTFCPRVSVQDCRDPKDDKYLELALEAGAWAIVSGDRDLLELDPWRGVRIVTPAEYVQLVSERERLSPP